MTIDGIPKTERIWFERTTEKGEDDYITSKEGSKTILNMPSMLLYFKNKPGDERYLKGMYLIEENYKIRL